MGPTDSTERQGGGGTEYEAPELTEYGTIEEWTQGVRQIVISIVIG